MRAVQSLKEFTPKKDVSLDVVHWLVAVLGVDIIGLTLSRGSSIQTACTIVTKMIFILRLKLISIAYITLDVNAPERAGS